MFYKAGTKSALTHLGFFKKSDLSEALARIGIGNNTGTEFKPFPVNKKQHGQGTLVGGPLGSLTNATGHHLNPSAIKSMTPTGGINSQTAMELAQIIKPTTTRKNLLAGANTDTFSGLVKGISTKAHQRTNTEALNR